MFGLFATISTSFIGLKLNLLMILRVFKLMIIKKQTSSMRSSLDYVFTVFNN